MLRRAALCAITLSLVGCALAHERSVDAASPDAFVPDPDAFVPDVDSGMPTSCTERWVSLAWCPADTAPMLGQHCETEGLECGTRCCEPGPAIGCHFGIWTDASRPDCTGVRCGPSIPCGAGACASDRICLHPSTEIRLPDRCVTPPFAATSCAAVPAGWLADSPATCEQCSCAGPTVEISLECACCD